MARSKNVLFILADQWRADCLSALGHPVVRTPNLDALAADGVLFRRHYAQTSPCGPSRASILTGLYAHTHRSVRNGIPLDARFTNLALEMRRAGFDPALIGYTDTSADPRGRPADDPALFTYESVMPGFTPALRLPEDPAAWLAHLRQLGYDVPPHGWDGAARPIENYPDAAARGPTYAPARYKAEHSDTAFVADAALEYLETQRSRSWFLHLVFLRPHPPWIAPEPYNRLYEPSSTPRFRRAADAVLESRAHPYLAWLLTQQQHVAGMPDAHLRQVRATYWGLIAEVDHHVGRLIAWLKENGQYDETLIIFSCDHGEMLGDHWLLGKDGFYDQTYHIPLIVRLPGGVAGRSVDEFSESVDLVPTMCTALDLPVPAQCVGRSLLPWLVGATPSRWRQEVFFEYDFRDVPGAAPERALGLDLDQCCLAVIRDRRFKYVHFAALPPLFFDLDDDPDELANRANDKDCTARVLEYAQRMLSWRLETAERTLTGVQLTSAGPVHRRNASRRTGD
ncbi:MAG TPA: alkaline phosphatase family protein [Alphaproteobacteria bacterium]|nr:alkaline phosphatase family protein [Alphaproteobacteria bacterium]